MLTVSEKSSAKATVTMCSGGEQGEGEGERAFCFLVLCSSAQDCACLSQGQAAGTLWGVGGPPAALPPHLDRRPLRHLALENVQLRRGLAHRLELPPQRWRTRHRHVELRNLCRKVLGLGGLRMGK
eukprot:50050-Chlamydomonas_euryale.AAC.1